MAGNKMYNVKKAVKPEAGKILYESPLVKVTQYTAISTEPRPSACEDLRVLINVRTGEVERVCEGNFYDCANQMSCTATKRYVEFIRVTHEGRPKKIDFGPTNDCYND